MGVGVRKQYLEYLCSRVSCRELPPPGRIVLRGKEIWGHPHVELYQEWVLHHWKPEPKPVALLLPCTPVKPYSRSAIRKIVYANLRRLGIDDYVAVITVSDPMLLVPREIEDLYPVANYEHPAELLEIPWIYRRFVELLSRALPKLRVYPRIAAFLSSRHRNAIADAIRRASVELDIEFYPYGRLAFRDAKQVVLRVFSILNSMHGVTPSR